MNANNQMTRHEVQNGPPLVRKLADLISEYRAVDRFSKVTVIVPSIYSAVYLRRATVRETVSRGTGLFNVAFERIEDVSDSILDISGAGEGLKSMTRLVASEVIHSAVSELHDDGGYLAAAANRFHYVDALRGTLHDLERLPDGAHAALERLCRVSSSPIYRELLQIYETYAERSRGWMTRAQLALKSAEITRTRPDVVSQVVGDLCILVPPHDEFDTHSALWDALQERDGTVSLRISARPVGESGGGLTSRFYSTVSSWDAPRQLVRNVISDASDGIKFGDMAVFVPDAVTAWRIRDAFSAAGIPVAGRSPFGLAAETAGRFVVQFLDAVVNNLRRDSLMTCLTSSPVVFPENREPVPATRWDKIVRRASIVGFDADSEWERRLEVYRESLNYRRDRMKEDPDAEGASETDVGLGYIAYELDQIDELKAFVKLILDDIDSGLDAKSWGGHTEWLDQMVERYLSVEDTSPQGIPGMEQVRRVLGAVSELDQVGDRQPRSAKVSFARFAETVRSGVNGVAGSQQRLGRGVLIAGIDAGIASSFDRVHVMGLSESAYQFSGADHPMLRESDRSLLNEGADLLPTVSSRRDSARSAFALAIDSASSRSFYWNRSNVGDTSDSYPSPFFMDELSQCLGRNVSAEEAMSGDIDEIECEPPLNEAVLLPGSEWEPYAALLKDSVASGGFMQGLDPSEVPRRSRGLESYLARSRDDFSRFDGNVGPLADAIGGVSTSASRLESYAKCPYSYFLREVLGVEGEPDIDEEVGLTALARGSLVHDILEELVRRRGSIGTNRNDDLLFKSICDSYFREFESRGIAPIETFWELEKAEIVRRLQNWRSLESQMLGGVSDRSEVERKFGYSDGIKVQVPIAIGSGETVDLSLRGRIDRMDFSPGQPYAMAVIDYKTGSPSGYSGLRKDPVDSGSNLQMAIYMLAARTLHPDADPKYIRGAFWFPFEPGVQGMIVPKDEIAWLELEPRLRDVLATITSGIVSGSFPVRPGAADYQTKLGQNCTYCEFNASCDSDRAAIWERTRLSLPVEYVGMVESSSTESQ